jgi:hypothetical protein
MFDYQLLRLRNTVEQLSALVSLEKDKVESNKRYLVDCCRDEELPDTPIMLLEQTVGQLIDVLADITETELGADGQLLLGRRHVKQTQELWNSVKDIVPPVVIGPEGLSQITVDPDVLDQLVHNTHRQELRS